MGAMTMVQALNSAMDVMLEKDPAVIIFGEDIGYFGGVFRCTEGLQQNTVKTACSIRRLPKAGLWQRRSAWV